MTLREAYEQLGGNYDRTLERLMSEKLMKKYLGKFLEDDTFPTLKESFEHGEKLRKEGKTEEADVSYNDAFEAVHTLKGVALNLGIDRLAASSGALCEALRGGFSPEASDLFTVTEKDYNDALAVIRQIG